MGRRPLVALLLCVSLLSAQAVPVRAGTNLPPLPPGVNIPGYDEISLALGLMKSIAGGSDCARWREAGDDALSYALGKLFSSLGGPAAAVWFAKEMAGWTGAQVNNATLEASLQTFKQMRTRYLETQGMDPNGPIPQNKWIDFIRLNQDVAAAASLSRLFAQMAFGDPNGIERLTDKDIQAGVAMLEFMLLHERWQAEHQSQYERFVKGLETAIYDNPLPTNADPCGGNNHEPTEEERRIIKENADAIRRARQIREEMIRATGRDPGWVNVVGGDGSIDVVFDPEKYRRRLTDYHPRRVVAAWDPNDLVVSPAGEGARGWIRPGQRLDFTVRFENEVAFGEYTVAAEDVWITLDLDPALDPATLVFGDASYPKTEVSYNPETGRITWFLPGINLPPNRKPPEGEGWVRFSVKPREGLAHGTTIAAQAEIIFDFNPPIRTPRVVRTIDTRPPGERDRGARAAARAAGQALALEIPGLAALAVPADGMAEGTLVTLEAVPETDPLYDRVRRAASFAAGVEAVVAVGSDPDAAPLEGTLSFRTEAARAGVYRYDPRYPALLPVRGVREGNEVRAGIGRPGTYVLLAEAEPRFGDVVAGHWAAPHVAVLARKGIVSGFGDGRYRPDAWLTREQAARMLSLAAAVAGREAPRAFPDAKGRWSEPYLDAAAAAGLLTGYPDGAVRPERPVTRAEFITMVLRALGSGLDRPPPFPDAAAHWAAGAIGRAAAAELVAGYPDGQFRPDAPVTRAEAAKVVSAAFGWSD